MNLVLKRSLNNSPNIYDLFRENKTKRENGAEREDRYKFYRESNKGRLFDY